MMRSIGFPALAAAGALALASGAPASAATAFGAGETLGLFNTPVSESDVWEHSRKRHWRNDRYRGRYGNRRHYAEPVYRNTRVWRGHDGRYYCRKKDGTTGLIIGGAVGALLGREIDGGYNRSLGTILGAAGGALLGREVARGGGRCR